MMRWAGRFGSGRGKYVLHQPLLSDIVWLKDTCERYAQYLEFSGQNLHLMGCV